MPDAKQGPTNTDPFVEEDSFAALFEEKAEEEENLKEGEIVKGRVVRLLKDTVIVDIGYKSEGQIPVDEFREPNGVSVDVGDEVEVLFEKSEDEDGLVMLSKREADRMRVWDEISEACEKDEIIEGTIAQKVKGGLAVAIRGGVKAFLPGSQVDLKPTRDLDQYIGKTFKFRVIKFNKKRGNIVLSRRVILEKEREELKSKTLEQLREGTVVEGIVKNITDYGAFVDLGGIDGLLHITDMSYGRVNHPSQLFNIGDRVRVVVLKYNDRTERVSLGMKQLQEDPWLKAAENYPKNKKVNGKVVMISDFGVFVELEEGIEGLIHVSEISWTKKVKNPAKLFSVGQEVECMVLDIDTEARRISLGIKQLEPDPWTLFTADFRPGDKIKGKVRSITDYGVFVEITEGVDGLVHKSDLSWTQKINHPSEFVKKGQIVEAVILNINYNEKKVSLGIKQLSDDPWERIPSDYPPGRVLLVKVSKVTDFGAFVEIEKGIEGLIHVSEMSEHHVKDPREVVKEGDEVKAEVITVEPSDRKIGLSMKTLTGKEQEQDLKEFRRQQADARAARPASTIGELIKQKMGDALRELPEREREARTTAERELEERARKEAEEEFAAMQAEQREAEAAAADEASQDKEAEERDETASEPGAEDKSTSSEPAPSEEGEPEEEPTG
jgi:small subunit ribosomal protein S1